MTPLIFPDHPPQQANSVNRLTLIDALTLARTWRVPRWLLMAYNNFVRRRQPPMEMEAIVLGPVALLRVMSEREVHFKVGYLYCFVEIECVLTSGVLEESGRWGRCSVLSYF